MESIGTIYYIIPDLCKRNFRLKSAINALAHRKLFRYLKNSLFPTHKPVGGIKVMYQHCLILKELGYTVYPLLQGSYGGNFFGYQIDIKSISDIGFKLNANDIVVVTEFTPYLGLYFNHAKKIIFVQSIFLKENLLPTDIQKSYYDLGYDYIIACSKYCQLTVQNTMGIGSTTITNGIDTVKFIEKPGKRINGRVLAISRKNPRELEKIIAFLGKGFDIHVVDNLTQDELINEYQKADVFLATGYPEGFSLPPLEAMSCGCAVVGYTGGGANEFMKNESTALIADDGNYLALANQLKRILEDDKLKEFIRENGLKISRKYSLENMKQSLSDFYTSLTS